MNSTLTIGGYGTVIGILSRTRLNLSGVILLALSLNEPGLNTFTCTLATPFGLLIHGLTSTASHAPVIRNWLFDNEPSSANSVIFTFAESPMVKLSESGSN